MSTNLTAITWKILRIVECPVSSEREGDTENHFLEQHVESYLPVIIWFRDLCGFTRVSFISRRTRTPFL